MNIPSSIISKLERLPLVDIMQHAGHRIQRKTEQQDKAYFLCPFHADTNPSFRVETKSDSENLAGWKCYACNKYGIGAIGLKAELMNLDRNNKDEFLTICKTLLKEFNIPVGKENLNSQFHRAVKADSPSPQIEYTYRPFTDSDLKALGCKVQQVFVKKDGAYVAVIDEQGPVMKYSWGRGFYSSHTKQRNFNPQCIENLFNIHCVDSFISEQRQSSKSGVMESWVVSANSFYPIFDFRYSDRLGWWSKKYEPLNLPDENGNSFKFTWWFENGVRRDDDLRDKIYGDVAFMKAYESGRVELDENSDHPSHEYQQGKRTAVKFDRLVICSGPRDGMNVYFHCDAHVCWLNSENADLNGEQVRRLTAIADEIFILFDNDRTGVYHMESLALKYWTLKVIYLPEDLRTIVSTRTGRPCKDAEEYFNYYPQILRHMPHYRGNDINDHFETMLLNAKPMKFWNEKFATVRSSQNSKDDTVKYEMDTDNVLQFLSAMGMKRYCDNTGDTKIVYINDEGVRILSDNEAVPKAKELMKNYAKLNRRYLLHDGKNHDTATLSNAISDWQKLKKDTLLELPLVDLDFRATGEDFDYIYFQNGPLLVTKDEFKLQSYKQIPYAVNVEAKVDYNWMPTGEKLFGIVPNNNLASEEDEYKRQLASASNPALASDITRKWLRYKEENRFRLELYRPMNELPPVIQTIYDAGRIYWRESKLFKKKLTAEQRQFQDMQFINKVFCIGYLLHRYRTPERQHLVIYTDYAVVDNEKSSGGTGKSFLFQVLQMVRKGIKVPGSTFKSRAEAFSLNFGDFRQTRDYLVCIDDLNQDIKDRLFYNLTDQLIVRSLYKNEIHVEHEDSPKILITTNFPPDLSAPSTYRRFLPMTASDYYHPGNVNYSSEEFTPAIKFHKDIIKKASRKEIQETLEFLVACLQFYLSLPQDDYIVRPPLDRDGIRRMAYSSFHYKQFMQWADRFFDESVYPHHYGRPIAFNEMVISFFAEYPEYELTVARVESRTVKDAFFSDLMLYCSITDRICNPDVCLSQTDRGSGKDEDGRPTKFKSSRRATWVTPYDSIGGYDFDVPRIISNRAPSCYFYYNNDVRQNHPNTPPVPLSTRAVLPHTDTDLGDLLSVQSTSDTSL